MKNDIPIYTAVTRFTKWANEVQLNDSDWERFFSLAREYGFDIAEPIIPEE